MPLEEKAERADGRLPDEDVERISSAAIEAGLAGGLHAREHGGQGWSKLEWVLVEEQFGRSTNALSWHVPSAYNVLASGSGEQIDRYLKPALRGELHDAYAVTEEHAGSDPSGIATTAVRRDGGWVINGEKWFVTYGDVAAVYIVVAQAEGGRRCSWSTARARASRWSTIPPFTHSYPHGHPTIRFTDVLVGDDAVIGGVGEGDALQRAWFTEERIGIAARGVGAMWRLLEEATAWALSREQGGSRIMDYQGVSFPLADSAADAAAGRALTLEVARLADEGADPKIVHAKASMAKLFVCEAAYRCADRAVQVFGGRGYMRTNVAERFLRELRVDRIWEGTSEIQRLIVARALERRGVERTLHSGPSAASAVGRHRGRERAAVDVSSETLLNLRRLGFEGDVWGVNPRRSSVYGLPCFASSATCRRRPTRSSSRSPRRGRAGVIEEAGAIGCGGAVVYAAGFGETPAGAALEEALREAARRYSLPVCGPNCDGLVSLRSRAALWGDALAAPEPGHVALVSQSGNLVVNALATRRGCGCTRRCRAATRRW